MQRCLELASLGMGRVAPNPMVGAVLVHDNRIIGEGHHRQYGAAHAEVNCINSVSGENAELISKSTLYVTLEPCVHFGKTPPCTDLIIEKKIPSVVIGCLDRYAAVNGKGIEKLQSAGVNVTVGVMQKEAIELNKRFFTFHQEHLPYIILKWAQTSNKKTGSGSNDRIFISNEFTNRLVHKWRTEEAAILVGTGTALKDDPALTARLWPGRNPVRLVIDMKLKLPLTLKLFDGKVKTIVFNGFKQEKEGKISYYQIDHKSAIIPQVADVLYRLQIQSVMVEGGAKLLRSFIDENVWDEARVITNEQLAIHNGQDAPVLSNCKLVHTDHLQTDRIETYLATS